MLNFWRFLHRLDAHSQACLRWEEHNLKHACVLSSHLKSPGTLCKRHMEAASPSHTYTQRETRALEKHVHYSACHFNLTNDEPRTHPNWTVLLCISSQILWTSAFKSLIPGTLAPFNAAVLLRAPHSVPKGESWLPVKTQSDKLLD